MSNLPKFGYSAGRKESLLRAVILHSSFTEDLSVSCQVRALRTENSTDEPLTAHGQVINKDTMLFAWEPTFAVKCVQCLTKGDLLPNFTPICWERAMRGR